MAFLVILVVLLVLPAASSAAARRAGLSGAPAFPRALTPGPGRDRCSLPLVLLELPLPVATLVWITALAAVGLNMLMGYAGQVSLGHAGFFGLGAYAGGIGPTHLGSRPCSRPLGIASGAAGLRSSAARSCG